ncbi:MAG: hypothetical protein M0P26_06045 [Bacteroidales bacterium]|nr:hypothetical protein [Bacteroidales bacterium]
MSIIIINGKRMSVSGSNISISNNKVCVDGKLVIDEVATEPVKLIVEGDLFKVKSEGPVEVTGDVKGDISAAGSVHCNDVSGNLTAMGSVHCGNVGGNATAMGSMRRS